MSKKHSSGLVEIKVENTLIRPCLLHNTVGLDSTHPWTKTFKDLQAKKKKLGKKQNTDDIEAGILKLQWCAAAYWDAEAKTFYLPSDNIEKGLREAAAKERLGKQAEIAIQVAEPQVKFDGTKHPIVVPKSYKSPVEYAEDYDVNLDPLLSFIYDTYVKVDNEYVFKKPVRIPPRTGARVAFHRPAIPTGAKFTYTMLVDTNLLSEVDARKTAVNLGYMIGVGVWRPKFGRFTVAFLE